MGGQNARDDKSRENLSDNPSALDELVRNVIIIEIDSAKNEASVFPPYSRTVPLRGRLSANRFPRGTTAMEFPGVMSVDNVPGLQVQVDLDAKTGRIFDPLSLIKYEALRETIATALRHEKVSAVPEVKVPLTDDKLATWVYWMRRLVANCQASLLKLDGDWPKLPGKVQVNFGGGRFEKKMLADFPEAVAV